MGGLAWGSTGRGKARWGGGSCKIVAESSCPDLSRALYKSQTFSMEGTVDEGGKLSKPGLATDLWLAMPHWGEDATPKCLGECHRINQGQRNQNVMMLLVT